MENILPLKGMELLFHHRSSHSRLTVLITELSGFSSHAQGLQMKSEPGARQAELPYSYACYA
jgi:hypothetical protein